MMPIRTITRCATIVLCCFLAHCATTEQQNGATTEQQNYLLGIQAFDKSNYDEAIGYFTAHLKSKPGDADAHLKLGFALLKKGALKESVDEFKKSLAINKNNQALALIKHGIMEEVTIFLDRGERDVAMRYLTAHLTINPDDFDTHILLTKEFINMGSTRNALHCLQKAVSLDPKNPEAIELLDYFSSGFH